MSTFRGDSSEEVVFGGRGVRVFLSGSTVKAGFSDIGGFSKSFTVIGAAVPLPTGVPEINVHEP